MVMCASSRLDCSWRYWAGRPGEVCITVIEARAHEFMNSGLCVIEAVVCALVIVETDFVCSEDSCRQLFIC